MTQPARTSVPSVLFVCLGNICRSPAAEGVFLAALRAEGLQDRVAVDSAGTAGYHIGSLPDRRMIAAAARRGYDLTSRARQVTHTDLDQFDLVIPMDRDNQAGLVALHSAPRARIELLGHWLRGDTWPVEVPDPWSGGPEGFEFVLDLLEAAMPGLIAEVRQLPGQTG